jgi:competence protein ComEC
MGAVIMKLVITLLFCLWFLSKPFLSPPIHHQGKDSLGGMFVVWDVGQGQWVTLVTPHHCFHFDMGGEFFPKGLKQKCLHKQNEISLTHWDMDHISFVFRFKKRGFPVCVRHLPRGPHRWKKWISQWPSCTNTWEDQDVFVPPGVSRRRNENSLAFLLDRRALITGDAPAKEERKISFQSGLGRVQFLVAGHHGSRTSSSQIFLNRLKNLKLVVASARFEKYRHPHPEVIA